MDMFIVKDLLMIGVETSIMSLSYKDYFLITLIWPVIYFVVAIILLLLLYLSITKKITTFHVKNKILVYVFLILSSFGLFYYSVPTVKYGIYLLIENESNTISKSGEITRIEDAYNSPRYYYEGISSRAKIVTIHDKNFYIYFLGDFEVGDIVNIEYLPKSTFILKIDYD
jgi:hypothetical protein